jgi:hypothetical protein
MLVIHKVHARLQHKRLSQPIEPPDKQDIAGMKFVEASVESRPLVLCSGCLIGEDQFLGKAAAN